jgi:hypothetical protein
VVFLLALFRIQESEVQPVNLRQHSGLPPEIYIWTVSIFVFGNDRIAVLRNELVLQNIFVFYQKLIVKIRFELPAGMN